MVKGVHKKIIEVRSPGGDYFEKAIFYLKPGITQLPPDITDAAAQMLMEELQPPTHKALWKRIVIISGIILIAAAAVTAAAVFI